MVPATSRFLKPALAFFIATSFVGSAGTATAGPPSQELSVAGKRSPVGGGGEASFTDPFAYCAAAGTVDAPDGRYAGEKMPDSIVRGMIRLGITSANAPPEIRRNAVWRCMNSHVRVCHFGANIPCLEKADTSQSPPAGMKAFCAENPATDTIPAAATGRATVFQWRCTSGKPEAVKRIFRSDQQGYFADFWHELTPEK
jgi:hypothetical protein